MGEHAFIGVEGDLSLSASLQELANVVDVLCWVAVIDDNVVDDAAVTRESSKGFVHPAVVMLGNGGDAVGGAEVPEPPKRGDEGS